MDFIKDLTRNWSVKEHFKVALRAFVVEADMPPLDLEDDLDYEDKYNCNDEGDDTFDEEDAMDEILDQRQKAIRQLLPQGRLRPSMSRVLVTDDASSEGADLEGVGFGVDQDGSPDTSRKGSLTEFTSKLLKETSFTKRGLRRKSDRESFNAESSLLLHKIAMPLGQVVGFPEEVQEGRGGSPPATPPKAGTSPLVLAVRLGRISCVQALLKHSPSINIPDGFGVTPIQYALFLLLKERHNKVVQQIADLILSHRPFTSSCIVACMRPVSRSDFPTLSSSIFRCAGNLNDSYVALPDIPTYLQGQWEKMAGNCRSKVLPLHVGVMQKKLETVRLMLDMGADPNTFGVEYSGDLKKDIERRRSLFREKSQEVKDQIEEGVSAIPYARLWTNPVPGM
eukprot:gene30721-35750_t